MKVFKFGGVSVKDADGVKNVVQVLNHQGFDATLVVISAMGKMTNAFEKVVFSYLSDKKVLAENFESIKSYHFSILQDLFENENGVTKKCDFLFSELEQFIETNTNLDYDFVYDQIVSYGELLSTTIVSGYLNSVGIKNTWLDARKLVETDTFYRGAKVNWQQTGLSIKAKVSTKKLSITQGFIAGNNETTTTLGREGSDFTAAIFAYCLDADSVTIWKDVDGVLNAHPKHFKNTTLLEQISYKEATEMTYYGASVIHPKTLKPLENKLIPLSVRSFSNLDNSGTKVHKGQDLVPKVPCFILKENQILVSISAIDFSFIIEKNLSDIFQHLHKFKLKVNLIQNSALSFSMCIEDKFNTFNTFFKDMHPRYKVVYNKDVTLYTIRHFDKEALNSIEKNNSVLLKQTSRETVQIVVQ